MKHVCLLLAMVLVLLCAGCGSVQGNSSVSSAPEDAATFAVDNTSAAQPDAASAAPDTEDGQSDAIPKNGTEKEENQNINEEEPQMRMTVQVNGSTFYAALEENEAVRALVGLMEKEPVTIAMSDYAGFEKVGPLGQSLPASNSQTTTQAGDIVLYNGNNIVIFYGPNAWSYTRLGHIEDLTGWQEALGSGDVTVTFSLEG